MTEYLPASKIMKEELTQFFWIPFSPWQTVFVLAVIGVTIATSIAFTFGKEHATKIAFLIPLVIVVDFCAIHAVGILAGGRAARLAQLLELPDGDIKIQPAEVQSQRYVSISPNTTNKGRVVPSDEVMLSMDEVEPVVRIYKKFYPERTAFNGLSSEGLRAKQPGQK
jgi:hypothetical protein